MQSSPTTVTTVVNKLTTTVTTVKEGSKYQNANEIYEVVADLVNDSFRPWYCQSFHKLGYKRVLELASLARADGKNPRNYFSYLLKQNINEVRA